MDFNMWEITGLVVLAIIVFGPEKLPELARKAARVIAYVRRIGNDARGQLRAELGPDFDNFHLSDLNPRSLVAKHLLSGEEIEDLRQIRDEAIESGQIVKDSVSGVQGDAQGGDAASIPEPEATPVAHVPWDPEAT